MARLKPGDSLLIPAPTRVIVRGETQIILLEGNVGGKKCEAQSLGTAAGAHEIQSYFLA